MAFGTRYRAMAAGAVKTLQNQGGWDGPVYIITDAEYDDPDLREESLDLLPHRETVRVVRRDVFTQEHAALWSMRAKLWKTELLDLVPCDAVFYLDVDIFVTKSVKEFMEAALRTDGAFGCFRDKGATSEKYHTGVISVYRNRSEPILERWKHGIIDSDQRKDQRVFQRVVDESELFLFSSDDLIFPRPDDVLSGRELPTFLHLTSWRRRSKFEDDVLEILYRRFDIADPQITDFSKLPPSKTKVRELKALGQWPTRGKKSGNSPEEIRSK